MREQISAERVVECLLDPAMQASISNKIDEIMEYYGRGNHTFADFAFQLAFTEGDRPEALNITVLRAYKKRSVIRRITLGNC